MNIVIRTATLADIPEITGMYRHNGSFRAQGDPSRAEFYFAIVRAAGGEVLVATEKDEVIGHLELILCSEARPYGRYGFIVTLEVREDRRRRGVGRALVERAIEMTRRFGGHRVEVWMEDDNEPALRLYEIAGFTPDVRMIDFEVAVDDYALQDIQPLGRELPPGDRPWATLRHSAGRQYPAAYCWWRAYMAPGWGLPDASECGAWRVTNSDAVVLADPWLVHAFLPGRLTLDSDAAWTILKTMFALRAGRREYVRTVLTADAAKRSGPLGSRPGRILEEYSLLIHHLP